MLGDDSFSSVGFIISYCQIWFIKWKKLFVFASLLRESLLLAITRDIHIRSSKTVPAFKRRRFKRNIPLAVVVKPTLNRH